MCKKKSQILQIIRKILYVFIQFKFFMVYFTIIVIVHIKYYVNYYGDMNMELHWSTISTPVPGIRTYVTSFLQKINY